MKSEFLLLVTLFWVCPLGILVLRGNFMATYMKWLYISTHVAYMNKIVMHLHWSCDICCWWACILLDYISIVNWRYAFITLTCRYRSDKTIALFSVKCISLWQNKNGFFQACRSGWISFGISGLDTVYGINLTPSQVISLTNDDSLIIGQQGTHLWECHPS